MHEEECEGDNEEEDSPISIDSAGGMGGHVQPLRHLKYKHENISNNITKKRIPSIYRTKKLAMKKSGLQLIIPIVFSNQSDKITPGGGEEETEAAVEKRGN